MSKYEFFWRSKSPFSHWYSCQYILNQKEFNCCEQGIMYSKAILFNDLEIAEKILICDNPSKMNQLGKLVKNFDQQIWKDNKEIIVYENNIAKFSQNPHLQQILFETSDKNLVETSLWSIGLPPDHSTDQSSKILQRSNLLGKALTRVKHDLLKLYS